MKEIGLFRLEKSKKEEIGRNKMKKIKKRLSLVIALMFVSSLAFAETIVDGGKGMVDVSDISKGTQTNDVKVTMDGEPVVLGAGSAEVGKVRITDGTEDASVNVSNQLETSEANSAAIKVAVETIDDFISGSRGLVTEDNSAAIKTAVELIDNAISGTEMQVDIVAPLPAGTNNIGDVDVLTLPSLPAGTSNIGDVDVLTLPALSAGANLIGKVNIDHVLVRKETSQDLSVAALNYTTDFAADTRVKQVMLSAATDITQTISVTFDSATGATYDVVLDSTDVTTAASYLWMPDNDNFVLLSGDEMTVACTNTGTPAVTVYVTVIGQTIN